MCTAGGALKNAKKIGDEELIPKSLILRALKKFPGLDQWQLRLTAMSYGPILGGNKPITQREYILSEINALNRMSAERNEKILLQQGNKTKKEAEKKKKTEAEAKINQKPTVARTSPFAQLRRKPGSH